MPCRAQCFRASARLPTASVHFNDLLLTYLKMQVVSGRVRCRSPNSLDVHRSRSESPFCMPNALRQCALGRRSQSRRCRFGLEQFCGGFCDYIFPFVELLSQYQEVCPGIPHLNALKFPCRCWPPEVGTTQNSEDDMLFNDVAVCFHD